MPPVRAHGGGADDVGAVHREDHDLKEAGNLVDQHRCVASQVSVHLELRKEVKC